MCSRPSRGTSGTTPLRDRATQSGSPTWLAERRRRTRRPTATCLPSRQQASSQLEKTKVNRRVEGEQRRVPWRHSVESYEPHDLVMQRLMSASGLLAEVSVEL